MICRALVLAVVVPAWLTSQDSLGAIAPDTWGRFLYPALACQLFDFILWNAGLAIRGIAQVSQTQLMQPFETIAASVLMLGESIKPTTLVFAFLVISLVAVGRGMPIAPASRFAAVIPTYFHRKEE